MRRSWPALGIPWPTPSAAAESAVGPSRCGTRVSGRAYCPSPASGRDAVSCERSSMAHDDAPPRRRLGPPDDPTTRSQERIRRFVSDREPSTPCVVVDVDIVEERYAPSSSPPRHPGLLRRQGEPAPGHPRAARRAGLGVRRRQPGARSTLPARRAPRPAAISYGNTIKKRRDIAYAARVRRPPLHGRRIEPSSTR